MANVSEKVAGHLEAIPKHTLAENGSKVVFLTSRRFFKLDKRYRFFRNCWNNVHLEEQKLGLIFLGAHSQQTDNLEDPG